MKKRLSIGIAGLLTLLFFVGDTFGAGYGKRQEVSILSLSNDADGCFQDQTAAAAGALLLNGALVTGGKCIFASAQQISIEGGDDNSGTDVVIVGKDADDRREAETLSLSNAGTAKSVRWYTEIDSVTTDGATAGDIEAGPLSTNGAVSATLVPDLAGYTALMSIALDISGTMTVTVEHCSGVMPSTIECLWFDTVALAAVTVDTESNIVAPVGGVRAKVTSYTSGTLDLLILQDEKK